MVNKQVLLSSSSGSMRLNDAAIKQWKQKVNDEESKKEEQSGSKRKIVFS